MKREWNEIEKNMRTCTIMMLVVGISLFLMGKTSGGIICVLIAVVFAAILISMLIKNPGEISPKEKTEKDEKNEKDVKE